MNDPEDAVQKLAQIREDLRIVLPMLAVVDFKISINECEAFNRLADFIQDDFVKGLDCDDCR